MQCSNIQTFDVLTNTALLNVRLFLLLLINQNIYFHGGRTRELLKTFTSSQPTAMEIQILL